MLPALTYGSASLHLHTSRSLPEAGKGFNKWKALLALGGALGGAALGGVAFAEDESEHGMHAPSYPWSHEGWFSAYDHASIRRGHQVMHCFFSVVVAAPYSCLVVVSGCI